MENKPDKIILHCSATKDEGDRIGFKEINEWHKARGWRDSASGISCGYHYVIRRNGIIELGRPESSIGAHCLHYNTNSLGVCYVGTKRMTDSQLDSFLGLYSIILTRHKIKPENVYGHYEFNAGKECPGQDMVVLRALLDLVSEGLCI